MAEYRLNKQGAREVYINGRWRPDNMPRLEDGVTASASHVIAANINNSGVAGERQYTNLRRGNAHKKYIMFLIMVIAVMVALQVLIGYRIYSWIFVEIFKDVTILINIGKYGCSIAGILGTIAYGYGVGCDDIEVKVGIGDYFKAIMIGIVFGIVFGVAYCIVIVVILYVCAILGGLLLIFGMCASGDD